MIRLPPRLPASHFMNGGKSIWPGFLSSMYLASCLNRKSPRPDHGDFALIWLNIVVELIARRNHHGHGILTAVAQADRPGCQSPFFRDPFCRAVQDDVRFSAPFVQGLDLPPGDRTDAGSQRFGCGFLGGKAHSQRICPSAAFKNFQFRKDPFQEALTVPVERPLDAGNFDDVDSGFEHYF